MNKARRLKWKEVIKDTFEEMRAKEGIHLRTLLKVKR